MRRKFLFRTFLFIFLSSLLSILLFSSLVYYQIQKENYQIAYNQANQAQEIFKQEVVDTITDYEMTIDLWSKDEQFQNLLSYNNTPSLNEAYNTIYSELTDKKFKAEVTVLNQDHSIILTTNQDIAQTHQNLPNDWGIFRAIQETRSSTVHVPQKTPASNQDIALSIGAPLANQHETIGYIIIDLPHSVLNEIYHSNPVPYHIDIVISDINYFSFFDSRIVNQDNQFLPELFRSDYLGTSNLHSERQTNNETILRHNLSDYDLIIYTIFPFGLFENLASELFQSFGFIIIVLFIISALISYLLALTLYRPIRTIMKNMQRVEEGNLDTSFPIETDDEMSSITTQFNRMMDTIRTLIKENKEKQEAIRVSEMKALQSQMKPHFIYNVLNSIKFMARLNSVPAIDDMVTNLAVLLRSNIAVDEETETVSESIKLVESYLKIQKYRYEDDLNYQIYLDNRVKDELIPRLIIQPLIENSIEHGIEEINKPGEIFLSIINRKNMCILIIEDNGKGINPEIALNFKNPDWKISTKNEGNGIGLKNIYARLTHYFGDQFEMNIYRTVGTSVIISFPLGRKI